MRTLRNPISTLFLSTRVIISFLYLAKIFLSYVLMLVVMSYNCGLFWVIVLGLGAGYFVFYGWGFDRKAGDDSVNVFLNHSQTCCD